MNNSISLRTQQQNNRLLSDNFILSKIANIPSEATKFLSEPKEYAKKYDLQLSEQVLKEIELIAYCDIPNECLVLQSRNPFMKTPVPVSKQGIHDICPVVTFTSAAAGAGLVAALSVAASVFAKR